ncbi:hypothetical protein ZWY2020_018032 [Hordeum vulgare]|nr:hypothetical protein ZWY2020_018032 [Hordeum vulgare]
MKTWSTPSDYPPPASLSCYTGEGGSSIMGLDLADESIESAQSLQLGGADIPNEIMDPDFCGIDTSSDHRCHHGLNPARKVAYASAATGRRFLGCPHHGNERCSWLKWIDEPWGHVLTRSIMHLWGKVAMYRHKSDELDAKKKEMNQVYLELWTERSKMESEHDQVVINLKNIISGQ